MASQNLSYCTGPILTVQSKPCNHITYLVYIDRCGQHVEACGNAAIEGYTANYTPEAVGAIGKEAGRWPEWGRAVSYTHLTLPTKA